MSRSPFLALMAAVILFFPAHPAQACSCEGEQDELESLWQGRVLEPLQTDAISCPELRYMRNIPYARHGFAFGDNWVGRQFRGDPRYQPDANINSTTVEPMLTPADRQNIDMLVAAEAGMHCKEWWEQNGEDPAGWNQSEFDEPDLDGPPAPKSYASIREIRVGTDGITYVTLGEATPGYLIERALDGKMIENEWLAPLSCEELDRVEDALYARYKVDFEDPADEAFFAAATMGVYTPIPHLTREGAEYFFTSQDKLTKLRVDRAQTQMECMEAK